MGWTFYNTSNYRKGKVDRRTECDGMINCEDLEVLKSSMIGSTYYAAVRNRKTGQIFAAVFLTSSDKKGGYNFGYKDMDETCGPCECKCPKAILSLLTPTDSEWANKWREKCWEYHNSKNEKPSLGSLRVGSIVEFVANGETYQATKTYGTAHLVTNNEGTRLRRLDTYWKLDHYYSSASSMCINSWGYEVVHKAAKEEEQKHRNERLASLRF